MSKTTIKSVTPGIYRCIEETTDNVIFFEDRGQALKTQFQAQFIKGNKLQNRTLENFEKL